MCAYVHVHADTYFPTHVDVCTDIDRVDRWRHLHVQDEKGFPEEVRVRACVRARACA